jgi:predicted amidohydrolase
MCTVIWVVPGSKIKIAVLVCDDSEFPELARLATMQGAQIIFVPFSTDTKNALPTRALLFTNTCD